MKSILRLSIPLVVVLVAAASARAAAPVFERPLVLDPALTPEGRSAASPVAATNGAGGWVAVWRNGADLAFSRSTDHALTFGPAAILNSDYATDFTSWADHDSENIDWAPVVAADASRFIAVWRRSAGVLSPIMLVASDDGGATWSAPSMLFDRSLTGPGLATDGNGTWVIVFGAHCPGPTCDEVHVTRSTDDGHTWSPPAEIVANSSVGLPWISRPQMFWSGGVWIATWLTGDGMAATDRNLVAVRSTDGGLSWSAPSAIDSGDYNIADAPAKLASDGTGNWIATWSARLHPSSTTDVLVARSSDGALTWSAPVPLNTDAGSSHSLNDFPRPAVGAGGEFVVAWQRLPVEEDSYGPDGDVFQVSTGDGGASWTAPVPLNAADTDIPSDGEFHPFVAHDPEGHWIAMWVSQDPRLASGTKGVNFADMVYALSGHPCGDGQVDPGETCDDGDRGSLDCCGRDCEYVGAGTACAADAELCTAERCDGGGICEHLPAPAGTNCDGDGDVCTWDRCDGASTCEHVLEPRPDCNQGAPQESRLQIEEGADPSDRSLRWRWSRGKTSYREVALYSGDRDFGLCLFDANGLVARADALAGPRCGEDGAGSSCWKWTGAGNKSWRYSFRNRTGAPTGMKTLAFKGKVTDASVSVKASGEHLELPTLPFTSFPLHVQLVNETSNCWDTAFSAPMENSGTSFRATSD